MKMKKKPSLKNLLQSQVKKQKISERLKQNEIRLDTMGSAQKKSTLKENSVKIQVNPYTSRSDHILVCVVCYPQL